MKRLATLFVLLFLFVSSAFPGIVFAFVRVDVTKTGPEIRTPKCRKSAVEYLKDAEHYYDYMLHKNNYPPNDLTTWAKWSEVALSLYQICSHLEQNR